MTDKITRELTIIEDLMERLGGATVLGLARALKVSRPTIHSWRRLGYVSPATPWKIVKRVEALSASARQF